MNAGERPFKWPNWIKTSWVTLCHISVWFSLICRLRPFRCCTAINALQLQVLLAERSREEMSHDDGPLTAKCCTESICCAPPEPQTQSINHTHTHRHTDILFELTVWLSGLCDSTHWSRAHCSQMPKKSSKQTSCKHHATFITHTTNQNKTFGHKVSGIRLVNRILEGFGLPLQRILSSALSCEKTFVRGKKGFC